MGRAPSVGTAQDRNVTLEFSVKEKVLAETEVTQAVAVVASSSEEPDRITFTRQKEALQASAVAELVKVQRLNSEAIDATRRQHAQVRPPL
jgi:hypothetical protein